MTDYQDALVLENLDLVNWVIRTRISIPNRPLLTYDDFYAIGCEAICRAALKYQPDMGAFAPFACRYIYNAIVDHCRAMNYRLERSVEISEDENASLLDKLVANVPLWMNHYSASQFDTESIPNLNIDDAFLQEAAQGEYCFVEDAPLAPFEKWIERIAIFRWNRTYPADRYFDLQLGSGQWHLVGTSEFAGHSHDLITMEVYER